MEKYGIWIKGDVVDSPYRDFRGTREEAEAEMARIERDDPKYAGRLFVAPFPHGLVGGHFGTK